MTERTEQEQFWAGQFGDDYAERNRDSRLVAANTSLFARILSRMDTVDSVIEFGANIGLNLHALNRLLPDVALSAVEINQNAADTLSAALPAVDVACTSILEFVPRRSWDVVLMKGVLIHIAPERLPDVYDLLHRCSRRYIVVCEYYNPVPVEVAYRGHRDRLFKRDFAGELLDRFADLRLADYGFVYRRDVHFAQDDMTWFVLEKRRRDISK